MGVLLEKTKGSFRVNVLVVGMDPKSKDVVDFVTILSRAVAFVIVALLVESEGCRVNGPVGGNKGPVVPSKETSLQELLSEDVNLASVPKMEPVKGDALPLKWLSIAFVVGLNELPDVNVVLLPNNGLSAIGVLSDTESPESVAL
jgi:hypothetical protein